MTKTIPFDASEYLDSEEMMTEYLNAVLEEEDPNLFVAALGDIAKARGMAQIAKDTGLSRESLYKSLRSGSKLRYETVQKILKALNVKLSVEVPDAAE
jgi:probable addiction module antidote protein